MAFVVVELPGKGLDEPQAIGPFDTADEAEDWADGEDLLTDWSVVELYDPLDLDD